MAEGEMQMRPPDERAPGEEKLRFLQSFCLDCWQEGDCWELTFTENLDARVYVGGPYDGELVLCDQRRFLDWMAFCNRLRKVIFSLLCFFFSSFPSHQTTACVGGARWIPLSDMRRHPHG